MKPKKIKDNFLLTLIPIALIFALITGGVILTSHNETIIDNHNLYTLQDNDIIELTHIPSNKNFKLEAAESTAKLQKGLMHRTYLGGIDGMLFIFNNESNLSFWMKNTYLSLDIIYLNSSLEVVDIYKSTIPNQTSQTYPTKKPAQYVIELLAGNIDVYNIQVGDIFKIND